MSHKVKNHSSPLCLLYSRRGFTLIELIVAISIVSILSVVGVVFYGTAQRQARDNTRIADLTAVNQAIQAAVSEVEGPPSTVLCARPCNISYNSRMADARNIDGSGWVAVNLKNNPVKFAVLPIDPVNGGDNFVGLPLEYVYRSDGTDWELDAALEARENAGKAKEGGNNDNLYEVGTNLNLSP